MAEQHVSWITSLDELQLADVLQLSTELFLKYSGAAMEMLYTPRSPDYESFRDYLSSMLYPDLLLILRISSNVATIVINAFGCVRHNTDQAAADGASRPSSIHRPSRISSAPTPLGTAPANARVSDSTDNSESSDNSFKDNGVEAERWPVIPEKILCYTNPTNRSVNKFIEHICTENAIIDSSSYLVNSGEDLAVKQAVAYAFLSYAKDIPASPGCSRRKHSPLFVHVVPTNAGVKATKDMYEKLWKDLPDKITSAIPVGFFEGAMSNFEIKESLKTKPPVIVATPGKLATLLDTQVSVYDATATRISLDNTVKVAFESLNSMVLYKHEDTAGKDEDAAIKSVISQLRPHNSIIAITTQLSDELYAAFRRLKPSGTPDLRKMIQFDDKHIEWLRDLLKHTEFIATNDAQATGTAIDKRDFALNCMLDPKTRDAEFGENVHVLAMCNHKADVDQLAYVAKNLRQKELAVFHSGEHLSEEVRWHNLDYFEKAHFEELVCTRRSLYGYHFKFLPAYLVVDFSKSWGEWVHVMRSYYALCEEYRLRPRTDEELKMRLDLPSIKFLYDIEDWVDCARVADVAEELHRLGLEIDIPHRVIAKTRG